MKKAKPRVSSSTSPRNQRGDSNIAPQNALAEMLETVRTEHHLTTFGFPYRMKLASNNYTDIRRGEIPDTMKDKVFRKIAQHLPKLTGENISVEEIQRLYETPAKGLTVHGQPPTPHERKPSK